MRVSAKQESVGFSGFEAFTRGVIVETDRDLRFFLASGFRAGFRVGIRLRILAIVVYYAPPNLVIIIKALYCLYKFAWLFVHR